MSAARTWLADRATSWACAGVFVALSILAGALAFSGRDVVAASARRRAIDAGLDPREFLRDRAARLDGTAYWQDGRPAAGVEIQVASYGGEAYAGLAWLRPVLEARGTTDASGGFAIGDLSYGMKRVAIDHGRGIRTVLEHVSYSDGYGAQGLRIVIGESTHAECDVAFVDGRRAHQVELEVEPCAADRDAERRVTAVRGVARLPVTAGADGFELPRVRACGREAWIDVAPGDRSGGLPRIVLDADVAAASLLLPTEAPTARSDASDPNASGGGARVRITRDGERLELAWSPAEASRELRWSWESPRRLPLWRRFPLACAGDDAASDPAPPPLDAATLAVGPEAGVLTLALAGYAPLRVELGTRTHLERAPDPGIEVGVRTYVAFVPFVLETADGALLEGFTGPFAEARVRVPRGRLVGHAFADRNGNASPLQAIVVDGRDDVLVFDRAVGPDAGSVAVCGLLSGAFQIEREHVAVAVQGRRVWQGDTRNGDGFFWVPGASPGPLSVYAFDRRNGAMLSAVVPVVPPPRAAAQWVDLALHAHGLRIPAGTFAPDAVVELRDATGVPLREIRLAEGVRMPDAATWIAHVPPGSYALSDRAGARDGSASPVAIVSTPLPPHAHVADSAHHSH